MGQFENVLDKFHIKQKMNGVSYLPIVVKLVTTVKLMTTINKIIIVII